MNRRALQMLLRSGRFLCLDARPVYNELKARNAAEDDETRISEGEARPAPARGMLFDLPTLNLGIFFKEVAQTQDDEVLVSTRVYFPYNDDDVAQGGESTSAQPEGLIEVLAKRGAIKDTASLSAHDQRVLEILSQLPTFDPFLLLSQRRELETERKLDDLYFGISEDDWIMIRRPVMEKISVLVAKANQAQDGVDIFAEFTGRRDARDEADEETRRLMTSAVIDAIWHGEASEGSRQLVSSFHLVESRTEEILFAWKGINYYEYQYNAYWPLLRDFFAWLGDSSSMPRDIAGLESSAVERFSYRRERARKLVRATNATVMQIIRDYNDAFTELVDDDSPVAFQTFLGEAPRNFLTVGLALGVLAHTATAWSQMTNAGKKPALKSHELEPFYDFIIAVNGQDFYVPT